MWKIGVTIKIRNSCVNNSVEALILFNVGHQGGGGGGRPGGGGRGAALCCIASGQSSISRFSLRNFDIWYFML